MSMDLFRREVIENQGENLQGKLILSQPVSYSMISVFLIAITSLIILFLSSNTYHRKQTVTGYLSPDKGLVTIGAPRGGRLLAMHVKQDDKVSKGMPLFEVQVEQTIDDKEYISAQALQNLAEREEVLLQKIQLEQENFELLRNKASTLEENTRIRIQHLYGLMENEQELALIKSKALKRANTLYKQGLISNSDFDSVKGAFIEQQIGIKQFQLKIDESKAEYEKNKLDKSATEISSRLDIIRLETEFSEIQAHKIQLKADDINRILAPTNGRITSIKVQSGQLMKAQESVISMIPYNSILQAELYIPSSAIGFIEKNQIVNIRFDAFPYQKFGTQQGRITEVSKTVFLPAEIQIKLAANEPVYRVIANLDSQTVKAFGDNIALRAGMTFSADVVLEERSLFEWLFEPLFSIKGKL